MRIKGIKRGRTIEIFEEIDIPDGQEVVIYMTSEKSNKIVNDEGNFWKTLLNFRQSEDLETMGIEPEIFANVRDESPGREVIW
ncbi:hypothetical protein [Calothrix rhizosoleniae]|uniref:hypothetical protein n=1 Tax=Calothrix rhizosoleniae TaxID=888997 RepID=UPI000B4975C1|nr:hypothetical protein [Calothrix rhizosoleniae]